ncbi:carbohydrate ABC transporter permease [Symbiobacterium terraclitae]|uniref:carbohydrate ABC transporter permease n=1 Tax=Symbiobacterium terraclitae TaxID=557451 RepID=UPI0035B53C6E
MSTSVPSPHPAGRARPALPSAGAPAGRGPAGDARHRRAGSWRNNRLAYAMVAPAFLFMLMVHLVPMLQGIAMSFLQLNQFTLRRFLRAPFLGLANYRSVLFDPENPVRAGLAIAARNTAIFSAVVTLLVLATGLGVALLMNRNFRGRALVRTLMLLPWVVPSYVVGILWSFMWHRDTGIINRILVDWLHLLPEKPFWLMGPNTIWAIILPTVWRSWPYVFIVFLAALQTIPGELYEAAAIDGAGPWRRFRHITLPLLRPAIAIQLLFQIIQSVYAFNIVVMMFGNGSGYAGEWGDLLMIAIQRQSFQSWLFGYGAAASVLLMLAMMGVVALWYRIFRQELIIR